MDGEQYVRYTQHLVSQAWQDPDIVGLVALGSTARRTHAPDEWSDHDVWVVTRDGRAADRLREDPSWLPEPHRIVAHLVETRHGRSVIYDDGHLIEVAVFADDELEVTRANDYRVLYDAGGIEGRLAAIAARTADEMNQGDVPGSVASGRFVTQLIIGLGRCGRGELLSGNAMIRGHALASLLEAVAATLPPARPGLLDTLDPHRRFESAYPDLADRLTQALRLSEVGAAQAMLDIAGESLAGAPSALAPATVAVVQRTIDRARAAQTTA